MSEDECETSKDLFNVTGLSHVLLTHLLRKTYDILSQLDKFIVCWQKNRDLCNDIAPKLEFDLVELQETWNSIYFHVRSITILPIISQKNWQEIQFLKEKTKFLADAVKGAASDFKISKDPLFQLRLKASMALFKDHLEGSVNVTLN
jgi:hypothetical protein